MPGSARWPGAPGTAIGATAALAARIDADLRAEDGIVQVDLDVRHHRNRPLRELGPQAAAIMQTALRRVDRDRARAEAAFAFVWRGAWAPSARVWLVGLLVGTVGLVVGTIPAGYGLSPWISLVAGVVILVGVLRVFGKHA